MDLSTLIDRYGYAVVFMGAFLEGETVLVLAGYAAHRGYLELPVVVGVAFVGSLFGDQLYYFVGRHWGAQLLARTPHWHARAERFRTLLQRHDLPVILSLRFLYGIRVVGALVIGMSGIRPLRFLLLNMVGAAAWSISVGCAGYLLGTVVALLLRHLARYEEWVAGTIALVGFILWLVRRHRSAPAQGKK